MTQIPILTLPHAVGLALPVYATEHSAGQDLLAAFAQDVLLPAGERLLVPTGLCIALPEGFEAQIRPRSGLALKHGVTVLNSPGTIDADYRGEIQVLLVNLGKETFHISRGLRVAQMIIARYERASWQQVDTLPESVRGEGGFGSTGTR